jgi:2-polyprenyl-3-methyl-5-hydroxy-6-metoxy-1,4-benzoquinol methylase
MPLSNEPNQPLASRDIEHAHQQDSMEKINQSVTDELNRLKQLEQQGQKPMANQLLERIKQQYDQLLRTIDGLVVSEPSPGFGLPKDILDDFAFQFHQKFRGEFNLIKHRQSIFLPSLTKTRDALTAKGNPDAVFVDLGCGRGEILEMLKESGIPALGVDSNQQMIHDCQTRGLEAVHEEMIPYLLSVPDQSLGGILLCQLVEHYPGSQTIHLLALCRQKLLPGGLLLVETINPKNMQASATDFYADPTHINPIYPETMQFMFEYLHFQSLEFMSLSPYPDTMKFQSLPGADDVSQALNHNFKLLNQLLFSDHDYAILGWKNE